MGGLQRQAVSVDPDEFRKTYGGENLVTTMKKLLDTFRMLYQTRTPNEENKALLVCADSVNCALILRSHDIYNVAFEWGLHEFYQAIIMEDGFFTEPVVSLA